MKDVVFAIGDVHGCEEMLERLLKTWNPEIEQLVMLGDYIDRGKKSYHVLKRVKELKDRHGAVALRGNHEQMFLDWIEDPSNGADYYYAHGGRETIHSFLGEGVTYSREPSALAIEIQKSYSDIVAMLYDLPYHYETERFVFVHAGVNLHLKEWKNSREVEFLYIRDHFHYAHNDSGKVFVFGHTPTPNLHNINGRCDIWQSRCGTKIGIDGAAIFGGFLHGVKFSGTELLESISVDQQLRLIEQRYK